MKKILVALLLLIAMVANCVMLASCDMFGGSNDGEDEEWNNEEVEGKINITFYHTMGENLRTVLNAYLEDFEAMYPNIHVIHEQVGGYDDVRSQISTELTVGGGPNLAYCYPDHVALYNVAKAVVTLDEFINGGKATTDAGKLADGTVADLGLTEEQKADFITAYYEEGKQFGDGKMYTMPLSKSTEVLYYNKTFFDANNLKVPTTWDEMEALCAQIKELTTTKGLDCIPLGYDSEANWFITMCEQLGTDYTTADKSAGHFLFDNAENQAFVRKFVDWYNKGYVTTQEIYGAYTSGLFTSEQTKQFSVMSIGSSAGATHQRPKKDDATGEYPFEVGIAPIPQANAEAPKVISQGPSLCIFGDTDAEVEASWLLVKFLTTNVGFQAEFSEASGYVPVIKSVSSDADYQKFLAGANGTTGIAALSAKVCLEQVDAYYTSPAFNGSSVARDEVGALLQACLVLGNPQENLSDAEIKSQIDKLFKEAVKECKYQAGIK